MNQIFCFKRYAWLLKRQWFENATGYKWGIALMALLVGLGFGLFLWISSREQFGIPYSAYSELVGAGQMIIFAITGILFLIIYSAQFFKSLASKHKKMFYFSLPVSPLERVAVAFTFVLIFMPVLILIVFNVFDFINIQIFNQIHGASEQMFIKSTHNLGSLSLNTMGINILGWMSYASVFVLCSLMFGKKGPVISIVFLIAFFSGYQLLWNRYIDAANSTFMVDYIKNHAYIYLLPICWTAMYFVMKRKEA